MFVQNRLERCFGICEEKSTRIFALLSKYAAGTSAQATATTVGAAGRAGVAARSVDGQIKFLNNPLAKYFNCFYTGRNNIDIYTFVLALTAKLISQIEFGPDTSAAMLYTSKN